MQTTDRATIGIPRRPLEIDTPLPAESTLPPPPAFETVELMQKDAPDVRFQGRLLGKLDSRTVDTRRNGRDSDRYTLLELYQLESGDWVAALIAASDRAGEVDIARVSVIHTKDLEQRLRERAVLEAFGWTWMAKAFADEMGWDHVQELA